MRGNTFSLPLPVTKVLAEFSRELTPLSSQLPNSGPQSTLGSPRQPQRIRQTSAQFEMFPDLAGMPPHTGRFQRFSVAEFPMRTLHDPVTHWARHTPRLLTSTRSSTATSIQSRKAKA
jgi:hypothetical protein